MVHKKIDHQFAFKELEYETEENYQPCIKLSFFFSKLPHVSYEHFHKHYAHVHADLTVASKDFNVCKIQRYVQTHQTPEMKEKVKSLGMDLLDYDGCSQIWVKSWDDWEKFFTSPQYAAALGPDCANFMDTSNGIKVMAGNDLIVFGKAIPDCDAKDGLTST